MKFQNVTNPPKTTYKCKRNSNIQEPLEKTKTTMLPTDMSKQNAAMATEDKKVYFVSTPELNKSKKTMN